MLKLVETEMSATPPFVAELRKAAGLLSAVLESLPGTDFEVPQVVASRVERPGDAGPTASPGDIRRLLQMRARRRRRSVGQYLEWPAWDMLLDIAAVKADGQHVSVSAVCISSGAPQSTALRKLAALEGAGLVKRYLQGADRRRVCLTLTDEAASLVEALLAEDRRFYSSLAAD